LSYNQHRWKNVTESLRFCEKCGLEQTRVRSLGGRFVIAPRNPVWLPKHSRRCYETKGQTDSEV